jgi:hypothetical protein
MNGPHRYALLAIAATLVLAVGASIMYLLPHRGSQNPPATASGPSAAQGNPPTAETVESVEAEVQLAEQHLQNAIVKLEQIVASNPNAFDPQTAAVLKKSNQELDHAIADSRAALRTDPHNPAAAGSLMDALKRKVALLQDTIALMNEMRKGNSTGAAQIVEGGNKS